ncbi:MAG: hypothetical protein R2857_07255 [Vampirovibrionales bacterium]
MACTTEAGTAQQARRHLAAAGHGRDDGDPAPGGYGHGGGQTLELAKRFCDDDSVRFERWGAGPPSNRWPRAEVPSLLLYQSAVASATPLPPPVTTTPD